MKDDDYILYHDLNLTIRSEVSRFLSIVLCFVEHGEIDEEMISWSDKEYTEYLEEFDISEEMEKEFVSEFLKNF